MKHSIFLTSIFLLMLTLMVWQRIANLGVWAGFILLWSIVEWSGWKYKRLSPLWEVVYWLVLLILIIGILIIVPYLNRSV